MQQIADWLEKLGLSEYAQRFAENRIDFSVLRDLTDQDLKDLGVVLGDRRKLLRAIGELDTPPRPRHPGAVAGNAAATGSRRRAPLRHGDVLRSGGFDRHCRQARCRRVARSGWRLSRRRFGGGDGDGRPGRQEARRRADGAVRLSAGAGERCRARSARGAFDPARPCRIEPQECRLRQAGARRAHRHRLRTGGGRCGGRDFRRCAEHRGAGAGAGRAGRGRGHGAGAAPGRRPVRRRGARQPCTQRRAGAGDAVPARSGERRRTPRGAAPSHAARRPRRGNRHADAALGAGAAGRWAIGADRRRAGLRQVPPDRGISHPAARSAAHLGRMELFAASAKHAAAPDRRMGPPALRRRRCARRAAPCGPGKLAGAGQARPGGKCRAACSAARHSAAGRPRAGFAAGGIAAAAIGGADRLGHGRRAGSAGGVGARRSALGRSDHARCLARHRRARRAGAVVRSIATTRPEFRPPWGMRSHHGTISLAPLDRHQVRDMVGELAARHALAGRMSSTA